MKIPQGVNENNRNEILQIFCSNNLRQPNLDDPRAVHLILRDDEGKAVAAGSATMVYEVDIRLLRDANGKPDCDLPGRAIKDLIMCLESMLSVAKVEKYEIQVKENDAIFLDLAKRCGFTPIEGYVRLEKSLTGEV